MFSQSCARFLVDRLSSEETADEELAPWTRPAPPVGLPLVRVGLLRRVADRVTAGWRPPPETLDMAMARLGKTSAHLLDDIGVRVTAEVVIVEVTVPPVRPMVRPPEEKPQGAGRAIAAE